MTLVHRQDGQFQGTSSSLVMTLDVLDVVLMGWRAHDMWSALPNSPVWDARLEEVSSVLFKIAECVIVAQYRIPGPPT